MPLVESVLNLKNQGVEFDSLYTLSAVHDIQDASQLESPDETHIVAVAAVQSLQSKYKKSSFIMCPPTRVKAHDKNTSAFKNLGCCQKDRINSSSVL